MQSERKIYADINSAGDTYITVTLSGEGVHDLTEPQIEAALSTDADPVKTAPAVAVKDLADAYQKYLDASALYNERLAIAKTKAPGTMRVDEERKAIDDARRAFDKLAVEVATTSVSAQVQDVAESKPLELNITKEWFEKRAALEGDHEVGAGSRKKTICIDPTPEELAELFRIAHRIPDGWQLVPIDPTEEMHNAARDWAVKKYGLGIGFDGSDGCYRAMLAASPASKHGDAE